MRKEKLISFLALTALFLLSAMKTAHAEGPPPTPPPGPDRFTAVARTERHHIWWLTAWEDNEVECVLEINHEGLPNGGEIYQQCGEKQYQTWAKSPPCSTETRETCTGYYLYHYQSFQTDVETTQPLPAPKLWISAPHCLAQDVDLWCPQQPEIVLLGEEPLDGYRITTIEGYLDETPFLCHDETCPLPLPAAAGEHTLRAWGYSSYGDSTHPLEAFLRVDAASDGWTLTVLSPARQDVPQPACAYLWRAFPSNDTLPNWLRQAQSAEALHTETRFAGLAGNLLQHGFASAPSCPQNGLLTSDWASPCGLAAALPIVIQWQNRYDADIWQAAQQYQISPWLLKNIFAVESQFWPGTLAENHAGLGQMTSDGADLALMWSPTLFEQFCPTVFRPEACLRGYNGLSDENRAFLRQALMASVNADCPACPQGLDMDKAHASVFVFADVLRASCAQTGQTVHILSGGTPGEVLTYEDLWRLTLANYHSGAGCLRDAIQQTLNEQETLSWESVSEHFPRGCQDALPYVQSVTP